MSLYIGNTAKAMLRNLLLVLLTGPLTSCSGLLDAPVPGPLPEGMILVENGSPGISELRITINGREHRVGGLQDNEARRIDVSVARSLALSTTPAAAGVSPRETAPRPRSTVIDTPPPVLRAISRSNVSPE